jgi:hypothetical protein
LPRENLSSSEDPPDPDPEPSSTLLLQAFKQTALSVTNLYKTAANEAQRSRRDGRAEGYQDCLNDLLAFVDKVESRGDPRTIEMLRQWAYGKRRKVGAGIGGRQRKREDREQSMESDEVPAPAVVVDSERSCGPGPVSPAPQRSVTPPLASMVAPQQPFNPLSRKSSPTHSRQQGPVFSFRANIDLPRHVPPPVFESRPVDSHHLPEMDFYSPPTSPTLATHKNIFHNPGTTNPTAIPGFRGAPGSPSSTNMGRHGQARAGSKRRFGSLSDFDFFEMAEAEKLQMGKRGRHT